MKKLIHNNRGEGYIDVVVLVLCAMFVIALAVKVLPVFIAKHNHDTYATELVREGYAAGYYPTAEAWEESIDLGDIYRQTALTPGLSSTGSSYASYAGGELEYSISNLAVSISNNGLASGESEGYLADATLLLVIPSRFAGKLLPSVEMTLRVQARYMPLF